MTASTRISAEISNTGEISEEDRLKILEGQGEGRGLYITYRIIRLLKGKVSVDRQKGRTTFLIRLPLIDSNEGQD